jgi:hypothetical protein
MLLDSQEVVVHTTLLSMQPLLANDINGMKASDHINHLLKGYLCTASLLMQILLLGWR